MRPMASSQLMPCHFLCCARLNLFCKLKVLLLMVVKLKIQLILLNKVAIPYVSRPRLPCLCCNSRKRKDSYEYSQCSEICLKRCYLGTDISVPSQRHERKELKEANFRSIYRPITFDKLVS